MSRPSFLAMQMQAMERQQMAKMQKIMKQYMYDTFCITMHEDFGYGYDRIKAIEAKWSETYDAYIDALSVTGEADVMQVRLDRAIRDIVKDKGLFYPFEERYPEIRQLGYGPRKGK